jgi:regulatory protein
LVEVPKITKIEPQKKRAGRYSVFVDEEYSFSLSENDLILSGIHRGEELTDERVEQLASLSKASKLIDKAYNYLSYRQRSRQELERYLSRHSDDKSQIDEILERLTRSGTVQDADMAASWIRDRQAIRPRSRRMLEQELRAKGIAKEVVAEALEALSDDDELKAAQQIAERKMKQEKFRDKRKLSQYLAQQGFNYDLIRRVLETLDGD